MNNLVVRMSDKKALMLGEWFILTVLFSFALWLRLRNLGVLGIYGDADYTYFAVKGILETGFPWLPSGMFYPRGLVYSYLAAVSSLIFGLSEFSLRFPNVLFSIMAMAVLYRMLKEFFGSRVALLTSLLFSISVWDIEIARHARMYEALLFFILLSSWFFYRGFIKGEKYFRFLVPLLFILTTSIHSLGIFVVTLFVVPFLLRNYTILSRWALGTFGVATTIGCMSIIKLEGFQYIRIMELMEPLESRKHVLGNAYNADFSLLATLLSSWELFNIAGAIVLTSLIVLSVIMFQRMTGPASKLIWDWLEFGALLITVILQQLGVAFWMFGSILFARGKGLKGITSGKYTIYSIFFVGGTSFWIIWGLGQRLLVSSPDSLFGGLKEVVRTLFFYPSPTILLWIDNFPVMTGIVIVGLVLQFNHASKFFDGRTLIVLIGFLGPLVAMGLFREQPAFRYHYMIYPFFLAIYVWVIDKTCLFAFKKISDKWFLGWGRDAGALTLAVFLVVALSENHSWGQAFAISERTYSTPINHSPLFHYWTHPDHKSAALYVKKLREEHDTVVVMDEISAAYLTSVNYVYRNSPPTIRSIYLGVPFIRDMTRFEHVLSQNQKEGRALWLITSNELLGPHRLYGPGVNQETMNFLSENEDKIVFSSPDSVTKVYRFSRAPGSEFKNFED